MGLTNDREPGGDGFAKLQEQQVALAVRDSELLREQGVLQGKIDAVQRRLDLCDGVALQAVGARDSLRSWLRVVESSAVGGLARRVHDGYRSTGAQASRAFERATTLPGINFEEPRNARNSFVRSVTRTLIFTVVAVTLGLQFFDDLAEWSAQYFWDRTTNLALLWGLLILGIVLFLVRVLRNHFKRHLRFRRAAAMAQHELDEAEREFSQSKRVEQRFDSLRPQLADWTRILGYVVHNPWRTDPQTSAQPGLVLHAPLPNTVEIAEPDTSDLATERSMAAVALRSLAGVGWRSRTYGEVIRRMALEEPSGDAEADPVAATRDLIDADSTSERNGMREKLLRKLEDPDSTLREAETQAAILNGAQALLSSDVMKSHVVRPMTGDIAAERTGLLDAPAGLEPHLPQWLDFLSAIADPRSSVAVETFSEQTIVQQLVPPFRTALWFPEDKGTPVARAVDEDAGPLEPRPDWLLLHSAPAHRNRGSDTALRLDVASAVSPEALSVFSREPAAGAAEEE